MGNTNTVPAQNGENLVDYLRRRFRSKTRKIDNLVAQELRMEEAEELSREDPYQHESMLRIQAIGNGQHQTLVPSSGGEAAVPLVHQSRPQDHSSSRHRENPSGGPLPYRTRVLLQEATPLGTRTYLQDVSVDDEYVAERICYEETYVRRRSRGPTVIVTDLDGETDTAGHNETPSRNLPDRDIKHIMPVSQVQQREQYRSRLSRLRQMTLNLFRGRRAGHQPPATDDTSSGDFFEQPRVIELESVKDKVEEKEEEAKSRPGTSDSAGRESRMSIKDKARPVNTGGATMITEGCRTPRSGRGVGAIRKKSGDVAIQKGPDRGIVWPKKMEEIYSHTEKIYYIEQFKRTELFRQRAARKQRGSDTWMKGLSPFQTWVIEHLGTAGMDAIMKPKNMSRPNNAKAKVECWRRDKTAPKRRHRTDI